MFQSVTKRFSPIPVKMSQDSQVVPDMAYTPREIIQKFSRGEKVPLGFDGCYDSLVDDPTNDVNLHNLGDDPQMLEDDPTRDYNFDKFDYVEEKIALDERRRVARQRKARETQGERRSNVEVVDQPKRKASAEELSVSDSTTRETTSEGGQQPLGRQT